MTSTPDTPGHVPPDAPGGASPAGGGHDVHPADAHGGPAPGGERAHGSGTPGIPYDTSPGSTSHGAPRGSTAYSGTPHGGAPTGVPSGGPTWGGPDARPRPSSTAGFFASMRRTGIWRGQDRWIGGVAAGVARRLDVDPLLVRGILVVLSFFGGLGLLLYGLGWALLPEESDGRIHLQEALRGNVDAALAGAVVFVLIGLARPGTWWDGYGTWGDGWFLLSLAFVALVIVGVVALARRGSRGPSGPPPHGTGWSAPPAGGQPWSGQAPPPPAASGQSGQWTQAPTGTPTSAHGQGGPAAAAYGQATADVPSTAYGQAAYRSPTSQAHTAYGQAAYPSWADARETSGAVPWSAAGRGAAPRGPAGDGHDFLPPVPPRPKTPGPGSALVTVVLALALLVTAGLLLWNRVEPIGWFLPVTIAGAVLTLLGLGIMLAGLRGRRGGALSVLGVLTALLVVPATAASTISPVAFGFSPDATFGDRTVSPTTAERAREGYELLAGDLDVDLSELELAGEPVTVPVRFGAGDLRVILPADAAVRLEIELGAGQIEARTAPGWSGPIDDDDAGAFRPTIWRQGSGIDATFTSPAAQEGDADLVVVISAGAGDITIEEQR